MQNNQPTHPATFDAPSVQLPLRAILGSYIDYSSVHAPALCDRMSILRKPTWKNARWIYIDWVTKGVLFVNDASVPVKSTKLMLKRIVCGYKFDGNVL